MASAADLSSTPGLAEVLKSKWPSEPAEPLPQAFVILRQVINVDAEGAGFFNQAEKTLQSRGVKRIEDIVSYCPNKLYGVALAHASTPYEISDIRVFIPGVSPREWSDEALQKIRKASRAATHKLPFLDFLLTEKLPSFCLPQGQTISRTVNILLHELVHLVHLESFHQFKNILRYEQNSNYLENSVTVKGGELQAYETGVSVEMRLLAKAGIKVSQAASPYFDEEGRIKDKETFKQWVLRIYDPYYNDPKVKSAFFKSRLEMIDYNITLLEKMVKPYVLQFKDEAKGANLEKEINTLKLLRRKIKPLSTP